MQFGQGVNPARVKAANQAAILKTIYHRGPIKRAEIAESLGLTLPTITTNIHSMMARGIVREAGALQSSARFAGRRAHPVDIVPESRHFLGVEIQGTRRAVCLLDYRGKALYAQESQAEERDYDRNVELSRVMIHKALSVCGMEIGGIAGIGVCLPGLVDTQRGVLEARPSYGWTRKDIRGDLAAQLGYSGPIHVENNACARAYGAQLFRREALEDAQTFAYLFIHQGVACPLVLNTAMDFGSVVGAGEVGHMVMVPNGEPCGCGNRGCLEQFASATGIARLARAALAESEEPSILREGEVTAKAVFDALKEGDELAKRVVERFGRYLGTAISVMAGILDPEVIVIGGGVSKAGWILLDYIRRYYKPYAYKSSKETEFALAQLGNDAGIYGCAKLILD